MEDFYNRKQQLQPGQRGSGSPRLKSRTEAPSGVMQGKLGLIETPVGAQKSLANKGTPTSGSKVKGEPKIGKSSIADVGISPQKQLDTQANPNLQRKRGPTQVPLDEQDGMLNSGSGILGSQKEDSFQKLYSKELDLDEDEVPVILHELNDSAIHFISHEQFERSLSLLQKAQTLLDRLQFQKNPKDRFLIQVTMHNMALCFQKMGALEECALCLDACLHQINSQYLLPKFSGNPTRKLKKIKYECKIHMQVCALLSQLHRHQEALCHAKRAVQISQYLLLDLLSLCEVNFKKSIQAKKREQKVHEEQEQIKATDAGMSISQASSKADLIYYDDTISMLERTAFRIYPIIKEIVSRMVKHKEIESLDNSIKQQNKMKFKNKVESDTESQEYYNNNKPQPINMKVLLGYLNQSEWLYLLNIGNIMQITPLTIHDLYSNQKIDVELSRDSILEKISFLAISYFCVSTELRFLVSSKEKLSIDPVQVKAESEFWHGKALEISCGFLPSESPLVTHILSSYQKHHAPVHQAIPEEVEADLDLRIIRPERGIDKSQFQPMIRVNKHLNIALSPLSLSPCNHLEKKVKQIGVRKDNKLSIEGKLMESISSNLQMTPENRLDRRVKNQHVIQTSLEEIGQDQIKLSSSVHAVINEISPRSPQNAKDQELKTHKAPNYEFQDNSRSKMKNLMEEVMQIDRIEEFKELRESHDFDEFDHTKDLKTIKFEDEDDQKNQFSGSTAMLNSLKKLEQEKQEIKDEDSLEMDEAEFIADTRPQRKYEHEDFQAIHEDKSLIQKAQHTKVFLKHEKQVRASPSPPTKEIKPELIAKVPQTLNVQVINKNNQEKGLKAVNQSMMAVPPSQMQTKTLFTQEEIQNFENMNNNSVLDHRVNQQLSSGNQTQTSIGKQIAQKHVDNCTNDGEKQLKKVDESFDQFEMENHKIKQVKPKKQQSPKTKKKAITEADGPDQEQRDSRLIAEQKKLFKEQISVDQLKEFLKQGKISVPSSTRGIPGAGVAHKREVQRPSTTLAIEESMKPVVIDNLVDSKEQLKRSFTPGNKEDSPTNKSQKSFKAISGDDTSVILKSDNSFIKPERNSLTRQVQKSGSSQEKSRSRSKGKSNLTKKTESVPRSNKQERPQSKGGAQTVPGSNKLTSRGQSALNSSNHIEQKQQRPPSSTQVRKLQQQRPDSRRMTGGKRRKVLQEDEIICSNRSGSESAHRRSANETNNKNGDISVDRSLNISSKGGRAGNFKTFQAQRQGANTHHVTTSNSPSNYQHQEKPRSSGHIGIGQLNTASTQVKMVTSGGFNNQNIINQGEKKKIKGRNAVDQSLLTNNSMNQSSYATESRTFQVIERSMNTEGQSLLENSRIENQSQGGSGSQNDTRTRINNSRPKSKKKLNTSNSANHQLKQQQQQQIQNEIIQFLNSNQRQTNEIQDEVSIKKQLLIKKALEMQLREGLDVRRKSANTTTNTSMVQGIPHSQSSAANGFSSVNTATSGNMQAIGHMVSNPMITTNGHHTTSMHVPNTHPVSLQQTSNNLIAQGQGSNSVKRKVLQANGGPSVLNNEGRITQPATIINTQSQKTINLQRLGIQMTNSANGLDTQNAVAIDFTLSAPNQQKQLQPLNNGQQNAQVLLNQLITFQNNQKQQKIQQPVQTLSSQPSQKKFFKERVSPQTLNVQSSTSLPGKPKKKSVSPHNQGINLGVQSQAMIDNYTQNPQSLFTQGQTVPTNSGIQQNKQRNLISQQQQPRINQVAQQSYSTNVVTTQSRKSVQERFVGEKQSQNVNREPTPVFTHEPYQGKNKERSTSNENTYIMQNKQPLQPTSNIVNQRQTLSNMYQQMKEQKEKEKKQLRNPMQVR